MAQRRSQMEVMEIASQGLFNGFYKGKTVFVTGHTGFKGSWLSLWLTALGAKVVGYALEPPTRPSLFEAAGLAGRVTHVIADIRDFEKLGSTMQTHRPEIVFHLAAQPLVRFSYQEPRLTYETNVMGTVNLFEAVRSTPGVRVCVNVTSDKCYENNDAVRSYRETDPMGGRDPYSSSKGCAELVTAAYARSFFGGSNADGGSVAVSSVRAGNVIGGGDWAEDRLVPDAVRALSEGREIQIRNPRSVRPWQHVLEPLCGYLTLAQKMFEKGEAYTGAWNFGPREEDALPVHDVASRIVTLWGTGTWRDVSRNTPDAPHEARYLKLDSTKARRELGWKPVLDLDAALAMTIDWYKRFYGRKENMYAYSVRQLAEYGKGLGPS